ncbi:hypothetical protein [Kordiimonas sp. SCSIO 12610]|uniref:hypothetical protein n=1 Tax=Kordiimonas sp. SCSIO 12610 TaxID=2829597 RepID=UPI00210894E1|nr:hypothetical protein [Kordiimonas sp. SCSIO 12610]UTW53949.1 hypothetical protein KFF44_08850 [Kordiimonas sp. SCSIO 12610]
MTEIKTPNSSEIQSDGENVAARDYDHDIMIDLAFRINSAALAKVGHVSKYNDLSVQEAFDGIVKGSAMVCASAVIALKQVVEPNYKRLCVDRAKNMFERELHDALEKEVSVMRAQSIVDKCEVQS